MPGRGATPRSPPRPRQEDRPEPEDVRGPRGGHDQPGDCGGHVARNDRPVGRWLGPLRRVAAPAMGRVWIMGRHREISRPCGGSVGQPGEPDLCCSCCLSYPPMSPRPRCRRFLHVLVPPGVFVHHPWMSAERYDEVTQGTGKSGGTRPVSRPIRGDGLCLTLAIHGGR